MVWKFLKDTIKEAVGVNDMMKGVKHSIAETIEDTKQRIEIIVAQVIKSLVMFLMIGIGALFLLVGLAQYLQSLSFAQPGFGLLIVGGVLVLLGILVKALK